MIGIDLAISLKDLNASINAGVALFTSSILPLSTVAAETV